MTTTPLPPTRPAEESSAPDVVVHVFGRTDVGRTREHNEDAFIVADLSTADATPQPEVRTHLSGRRGSLFMVADGMGGAAAGEIASAMAVEVVVREVHDRWTGGERRDAESFATALKLAAATANAKIHAYAGDHPEFHGMGTTATIAGLLDDTLYLAQVGDSRAYLVREGAAIQITKDQSLLQKLIEAGELTEEQAEQSERRNIILQALGPEAVIRVDLTHQAVRRGDVLVMCSDGLSGLVKGSEIGEIVSREPDLVSACERLIELANERGGPDNITVIVARFEGGGLRVATPDDLVGHQVFRVNDGDTTPLTPARPFPPVMRHSGGPRAAADATRYAPPEPTRQTPPAGVPHPSRQSRVRTVGAVLLGLALVAASVFVWRTAQRVGPSTDTVGTSTKAP